MTAVDRPSNGKVIFDAKDLPYSGRIGVAAQSLAGDGYRILLTPDDARVLARDLIAYIDAVTPPVTPSQADRRPHPDVMAPTAQSAAAESA